ncbi:hypothetical protein Clacol_007709 [Clathrus columnatus]|uniref:Peptidase S53 activation domain-containing protein n=1 Tax=Clathrus columnatus TaxID=1419009 RepID=A0AAV5AGI0_9AGAM|nr:hypothetical protein Clacol_007709 [Clathrus columnatus]
MTGLENGTVDSFVRPSIEASPALDKWLADQGITTTSKSSAGNLVKIQVPVKKANIVLDTTFQSVTHIPSNRSVVRAMRYSLPERLSNHTQGIHPITKTSAKIIKVYSLPPSPDPLENREFPSMLQSAAALMPGATRLLPQLAAIQDLYKIPGDTPDQEATGGVGIMTFNEANIKGLEVAKYLQTTRADVSLSDVRLDVMSVSKGDNSPTDTSASPEGTICNAIMKLESQKISFLVTTGSEGALGTPPVAQDRCFDFMSFFINFHLRYSAPYQVDAVNGYLNQIDSLPINGLSNIDKASGRGYPDIAAITGNVWTIFNGEGRTFGTGAFSNVSIVAAIIADLNAQRQSLGKSTLGFLNPLIYLNPHAFMDITQDMKPQGPTMDVALVGFR